MLKNIINIMNEFWKKYWKEHVDKVGEDHYLQVGRSLNGKPMDDFMFKNFANYIIEKLDIKSNNLLLDFCCGNGLLSTELAKHCQHVTSIDFNKKLILEIDKNKPNNITCICSDVMEKQFQPASFDRIVFANAIQYFSMSQVISLFKNIFFWLKPGGIFMVTDIPDNERIWNFYNSEERETIYFQSILDGNSPLGNWYDQKLLKKLAQFVGFNEVEVLDEPDDYWYSHYRFDLICNK